MTIWIDSLFCGSSCMQELGHAKVIRNILDKEQKFHCLSIIIDCQVSTTTYCHHNSVERTSLNWRILHAYKDLPSSNAQPKTTHNNNVANLPYPLIYTPRGKFCLQWIGDSQRVHTCKWQCKLRDGLYAWHSGDGALLEIHVRHCEQWLFNIIEAPHLPHCDTKRLEHASSFTDMRCMHTAGSKIDIDFSSPQRM